VSLKIGNTYYRITYADPGLTMPGIKPVIYIGENILEGQEEDLHYFQDTASFIKYGIATKAQLFESINCSVISCNKSEIEISIVELEQLPEIINTCINNSKRLNHPKLQAVNKE